MSIVVTFSLASTFETFFKAFETVLGSIKDRAYALGTVLELTSC